MKMRGIEFVTFIVASFLSVTSVDAASNAIIDGAVDSEVVTPGVWNKNFSASIEYARKNHIPVLMYYGSTGCGYCSTMCKAINLDTVRSWIAAKPIVLIYKHPTPAEISKLLSATSAERCFDPDLYEARMWVKDKSATIPDYPRLRVWWEEVGGTVHNASFCGRDQSMPVKTPQGSTEVHLAEKLVATLDLYFSNYEPSPQYRGGQFDPTDYCVTNGVSESVVLRINRDSELKNYVATNWITFALNDGVPTTNQSPVVWMANESAKEYTCELGDVWLDYSVTNIYTVQLLSDSREAKSTATIVALPYPYKGGVFLTSTEPHARLEVDVGTSYVEVPITRTLGEAFSQKIVVSQIGKLPMTNVINWAYGQLSTNFVVKMADGMYVEDKEVVLTLLDDHGLAAGETVIACVSTVANSSTNPYWIGEKTHETLAWGDWTMDLVAATQKVAAAEGDAFTLILVGGSKWCPDCVKTDRWLLDQSAFKDWAKTRHVVCVDVDVPRVTSDAAGGTKLEGSPSLLTYDAYTVSDRYVEACEDGEQSRVQSGAGYLSRHGIPQTGNGGTNATAIAERNARLFLTSTEEGGLCRPDCVDPANDETGKFKTGVPCLIVMDKAGRIIGRNFQFNNESPSAFKPSYIDRLDELLAQAEDSSEESNDSWQTTRNILRLRDSSGAVSESADLRKSVSYHDNHDWYRVAENATGAKVEYRLTGDEDVTVELKVVRILNGGESEIARETGSLKDGVTVAVASMPTNAFVCVSSILKGQSTTDGFFALTNATSTVAKYVLTSDAVLVPSEVRQTFAASQGEQSVTVAIVKGNNYRFAGEGVIEDTRLTYNLDLDVYVANNTGTVNIPLDETTFAYQIWNTGSMAFETLSGDANEPGEGYVTHTVRVMRRGGTSGVGKVCVRVDKERSTPLSGVYEFDYDGATNTWAEGASEDWELPIRILANDYADGAQQIVLVLSAVAGSDVKLGVVNEYTITIADNDAASSGKVEIASSTPAKAGSCVYAKAGTSVALALDRVGGADGAAGCTLVTTDGMLDRTHFTWNSRDDSVQTANLSLVGVSPGETVTVTLTPDAGTRAVSAARTLVIKIIESDGMEFVTNAVTYAVHRHVNIGADKFVSVKGSVGGLITVAKVSGIVPGGIKYWSEPTMGNALVFAGIPTAVAGEYTAVFQVREFFNQKLKKGLVVAVTFRVIDPVKVATGTGTALNPACAKARTFADLQVYSDQDWSRLVGLLTVTIPASGRLSAKYLCASGTVSLLARSWSSITSDGALKAELVGTTQKAAGYLMSVTAFADGSLTCALRDPSYRNPLEVMRAGDAWSLLEDGAEAWKGYYTASLAQRAATNANILAKGDGLMTFKMTSALAAKKGRMAYVGVLPNGKAFSGAHTLWGYYYDEFNQMVIACLPVFSVSTSDDVSGLIFIKPNALAEHETDRWSLGNVMQDYGHDYETSFVWTSKTGAKAGKAYEAAFDVYGTYYNVTENLSVACFETFKTDQLTFFARPSLLDEAALWCTNGTGVSVKSVKQQNEVVNDLTLVSPEKDQNLTLSFNRATGLVSGRLEISVFGLIQQAMYKGVVLPGWGTASCTECGDPKDSQKRPFVSGSCWFTQDDFKYACPFSIGLEEGR